jgi:hypothetical protein
MKFNASVKFNMSMKFNKSVKSNYRHEIQMLFLLCSVTKPSCDVANEFLTTDKVSTETWSSYYYCA